MNPAFRNRLIRSRIRISDVEDTRRKESFNERCPNGKISLFNSLHCLGEIHRTQLIGSQENYFLDVRGVKDTEKSI